MNYNSDNERRLFETLDALDELHDSRLHALPDDALIEYAKARSQIMLTAEVHKMRSELNDIFHAVGSITTKL